MIQYQRLVLIILRLSIASVFLYAAVAATLEPENWIGYLPQMLRNIFPAQQVLLGFSTFEFLLSVWILSGWKSFYSGIVAAATLVGIIAANIGAIDIVFRDISIFFAATALTLANYKKKKN